MKKNLIYLSLILLAGCAAPLIEPTQQDATRASARWEGTDLNALIEGKKLYTQHCGNCHKLFRPAQFTEEKWLHELPKMKTKASIGEPQIKLIEHYLLTMREVK